MSTNSKSIDRMNKAFASKEVYEPGKFELGSVAPSLVDLLLA